VFKLLFGQELVSSCLLVTNSYVTKGYLFVTDQIQVSSCQVSLTCSILKYRYEYTSQLFGYTNRHRIVHIKYRYLQVYESYLQIVGICLLSAHHIDMRIRHRLWLLEYSPCVYYPCCGSIYMHFIMCDAKKRLFSYEWVFVFLYRSFIPLVWVY